MLARIIDRLHKWLQPFADRPAEPIGLEGDAEWRALRDKWRKDRARHGKAAESWADLNAHVHQLLRGR